MDLSYGEENEALRLEVQDFLTKHWSDADRKNNPPFKGHPWLVERSALFAMRCSIPRSGAKGTMNPEPAATWPRSARVECSTGDHWVVNGQKIWTTMAHVADWMFCLVRTEPEAPKHKGISYLLIDMKTPGITVRPLAQITGEVDFNEVFLEDVRVPATNIVGKRGEGWAVSMSTLKHERDFMSGVIGQRLLDGVSALAQSVRSRGRPAIKDSLITNRLVELESKVRVNIYHTYRLLTMRMRRQDPGLAGMVGKLYCSTLLFDMSKLAMDIIGDRGALWGNSGRSNGIAPYSVMESFSLLIGGGTANIQRNLIAERGLGLPR